MRAISSSAVNITLYKNPSSQLAHCLVQLFMATLLYISLATLLACARAATFSGSCNSYEAERLNEGYHRCAYTDPKGLRTIGIGFNLEKSGARSRITDLGADYDAVMKGLKCLNDVQIRRLFWQEMESSVSCVSRWLPNWSSLKKGPKSAVVDMAFNMGCAGVQQF